MSSLPYRPNVCLLILNSEGNVLIGERYASQGLWQLPQGGMDGNTDLNDEEHVRENALREASEELGVSQEKFAVRQILSARHEYDFINPPSYAIGVFRGQSQRFVVLNFSGSAEELSPLSGDEPEFSQFAWVPLARLLDSVEPRRRQGYEKAVRELAVNA